MVTDPSVFEPLNVYCILIYFGVLWLKTHINGLNSSNSFVYIWAIIYFCFSLEMNQFVILMVLSAVVAVKAYGGRKAFSLRLSHARPISRRTYYII